MEIMISRSGAERSHPAKSHAIQEPPNKRHMRRHEPIEMMEEKNSLDMIIAYFDPAWQQTYIRVRSCAESNTLVLGYPAQKWNFNFGFQAHRQNMAVLVAEHEC